MASITSASPALFATLPSTPKLKCSIRQATNFSSMGGVKQLPKIQITKAAERSFQLRRCFKNTISCSIQAQPETLEIVQSTIAKQLSIDECTVSPQTKFADLGADSLDTVEIMMALEEKFGVSVGEGGAENIATVQDAADLIEKVKAASA
ncbi:uncharacterized protein LOC114261176 isoform X1 [Camellia sinensis]|uniref:uncharacterized protein LOC114261176 isoform X1 n=1 Tax=Camellia sinensis TaxID=4442 RepID=UPI0010365AA9|nr:uncharacterized protein LOC114261176 isoform X1 [Camellia sinensis]XP_028057184.1 uncharacterized protein LOC114261176 isoform X1 [Camellia sinensis]XP_028057185.1 uncharacterized protein LOC114261176 isoform X1 [Camellia sinensis]